jgi:2-phospho-L-lactate guanylyltransferase
VVVPVRSFRAGKARLATVLDDVRRSALARTMAERVVVAAGDLPVAIVCDDANVAAWADGLDLIVLKAPGQGLNRAVAFGVDHLAASGVKQVVVAHADLPLAARLAWVAAFPGLTIVPDRHDDGTNVVSLPTGVGFSFSYGPGSFRRHAAEGRRVGLGVRVVRERALGWDVDVPDDLVAIGSLVG